MDQLSRWLCYGLVHCYPNSENIYVSWTRDFTKDIYKYNLIWFLQHFLEIVCSNLVLKKMKTEVHKI